MSQVPLSPTARTRITRLSERGAPDRSELLEFLDEALVAHVGLVAGDHPVVLPTTFDVDPTVPTTAAPSTSTARSPRAGCAELLARRSA